MRITDEILGYQPAAPARERLPLLALRAGCEYDFLIFFSRFRLHSALRLHSMQMVRSDAASHPPCGILDLPTLTPADYRPRELRLLLTSRRRGQARDGPMPLDPHHPDPPLKGHALRNAHLRERALRRAETAPPLARVLVTLRAQTLGLTRLELARRSGISRGTLRDLELGIHTPTRRTLQQFADFCQGCGVDAAHLEEVYQLYAGAGAGL